MLTLIHPDFFGFFCHLQLRLRNSGTRIKIMVTLKIDYKRNNFLKLAVTAEWEIID